MILLGLGISQASHWTFIDPGIFRDPYSPWKTTCFSRGSNDAFHRSRMCNWQWRRFSVLTRCRVWWRSREKFESNAGIDVGRNCNCSTLPETNSQSTWKMDGCSMIVSFWDGRFFQGLCDFQGVYGYIYIYILRTIIKYKHYIYI